MLTYILHKDDLNKLNPGISLWRENVTSVHPLSIWEKIVYNIVIFILAILQSLTSWQIFNRLNVSHRCSFSETSYWSDNNQDAKADRLCALINFLISVFLVCISKCGCRCLR